MNNKLQQTHLLSPPSLSTLVAGHLVRGAYNKFQDFFVRAFKIVVDSWKSTMLLLYIL